MFFILKMFKNFKYGNMTEITESEAQLLWERRLEEIKRKHPCIHMAQTNKCLKTSCTSRAGQQTVNILSGDLLVAWEIISTATDESPSIAKIKYLNADGTAAIEIGALVPQKDAAKVLRAIVEDDIEIYHQD